MKNIKKMEKEDQKCIFCKIINGEIPSFKIFSNEKVYCFLDINPLSLGHCLIIPKYHAQKVHELPSEYLSEIGKAIGKVSNALVKNGMKDYNVLQNNGSLAHQAVFHVHFHIIPKTCKEDGLGISWPSLTLEKEALKEFSEKLTKDLWK